MKQLETSRLKLRNLGTQDAGFIFDLLNSPTWLEHIGNRGINTLADATDYIKHSPSRSYGRSKYGLKAVILKVTNQPIGVCGLIQRDFLAHPDLGFAFLPEYAGKGYGYESSCAVLREPTKRWPVYAMTDPENHASQGLLKKLGFVQEGTFLMPPDQFQCLMFKLENPTFL